MMGTFSHLYPWQVLTKLNDLSLSCALKHPLGPLRVDLLQKDLDNILEVYQPARQSGYYHRGGWTAIGLITCEGDVHEDRLLKGPYQPTPALSRARYMKELIDALGSETYRVRLMQLQAGGRIYWHYDRNESIDGGKSVRLHVPIITDSAVKMQLSHEDLYWRPGEMWYGDFSFPHRLRNDWAYSRVHLVLDLKIDERIISIFDYDYLNGREKRLLIKPYAQKIYELFRIQHLVPRLRRRLEAKAANAA